MRAPGTPRSVLFERRHQPPQVFRTRHFPDVPALHGPALPFRPASYLADPEVQDSITVRSLLRAACVVTSRDASQYFNSAGRHGLQPSPDRVASAALVKVQHTPC